MSPEVLAKKIEKWADQGLDYTLVASTRAALEQDLVESRGRIHSRSGALARSMRITEPSATRTRRKGYFTVGLSAGSRAKANPIPYAYVLQYGHTYQGATKTRPHWIPKQTAGGMIMGAIHQATGLGDGAKGIRLPGGAIRRAVWHPGSRLVKQEYARVNQARARFSIDHGIAKSAAKDLA